MLSKLEPVEAICRANLKWRQGKGVEIIVVDTFKVD